MTDAARRATRRRIGPVGTSVRVVLGLVLVYLATVEEGTFFDWEVEPAEIALGLVGFPAVMVVVGLAAGFFLKRPLRLIGPGGLALNAALIFVLLIGHQTHDAALFFYGVSFPLAAWRGVPGCEMTVLSNLILGRDDQIGCPVLAPVDALETGVDATAAAVGASPRVVVLQTGICLVMALLLAWRLG